MNTCNEDIINECEFLRVIFEERNINGQSSYIGCPSIKSNLCKHPDIIARRTPFYCEPDKHSWCPYNKNEN